MFKINLTSQVKNHKSVSNIGLHKRSGTPKFNDPNISISFVKIEKNKKKSHSILEKNKFFYIHFILDHLGKYIKCLVHLHEKNIDTIWIPILQDQFQTDRKLYIH